MSTTHFEAVLKLQVELQGRITVFALDARIRNFAIFPMRQGRSSENKSLRPLYNV
jgi:hypothetical protein